MRQNLGPKRSARHWLFGACRAISLALNTCRPGKDHGAELLSIKPNTYENESDFYLYKLVFSYNGLRNQG
ncbi:MAG: hypothetical protein ACR5LG_03045 [Sodalis sp. (in: enterobacteria)]|uniref:hypothetical protein n=1 Tax=Sodalis sp. (in: enterobacteria) TaxID=1898979 RepID=UPI003F2F5329